MNPKNSNGNEVKMKLHTMMAAAGGILLALALNACSSVGSGNREEVTALKTRLPVKIDGRLDEPAWYKTPAYPLVHARKQFDKAAPDIREFFRNGVVEPGKVRMLWDEKYLYIGFEFTDQDIVAQGQKDQLPHYTLGDTAEVFIKPANKSWYWELYVTPPGRNTVFFFPSRGMRELPGSLPAKSPLKTFKTAAFVKATLNNSWDRDKKWTAEMAIPRAELGMVGERLDPDVPWLIFFGRYNYGRNLTVRELTSFPVQEENDFHSHYDYAALKMVKEKE